MRVSEFVTPVGPHVKHVECTLLNVHHVMPVKIEFLLMVNVRVNNLLMKTMVSARFAKQSSLTVILVKIRIYVLAVKKDSLSRKILRLASIVLQK